ncbi:HAMP domain-containing sensor histidine kinase [Paenibacillus sp. FSL R10-2734]|uniref:sensor histidine kinase n=1 Tax=Paenibacillus sp. FSL R10-2734 TaxID=2954691 RepID=UPI0030D91425
MIKRLRSRISLPIYFSLALFIIFLITMLITGVLIYLLMFFGLLDEQILQDKKILTLIILIACTIIGSVISITSSRRWLKSIQTFIDAIDQLAKGNFSMRMQLTKPPEFKILSENINRMAEELGGIEILRTDFVNNFSHEFRTPIVSIKGFAEILKDDALSKEERNEYLDIVIEESTRLAALASNVLNISKIEAQAILSDRQPFNVGEQIRQCILLLHTKLTKKHISFKANVQDYEVSGNKEMLSQVWLNLLDNAIKFTPEHGEIEVTMKRVKDRIEITIRDNGEGISPSALPKVFAKFYQQDTSHSTAGNGLGLTIVRKIIGLHDGTITCDSVPSQGTIFTTLLPASKKVEKEMGATSK